MTEVAERAGHTVKVLLQIYAKCIDGQQDRANKRIDDALTDRPYGGGASGSSRGPSSVSGATCGNIQNPIPQISRDQ